MKEKTVPNLVCTVLQILLSLLLAVGSIVWFHACGAKEDGSYMTCHWAQVMVTALGAAMLLMSLVQLLFRDFSARRGISAALVLMAVLTALVPQTLIHMCMMADMRCQSLMRPAVIVISAGLAFVSLVQAVSLKRNSV